MNNEEVPRLAELPPWGQTRVRILVALTLASFACWALAAPMRLTAPLLTGNLGSGSEAGVGCFTSGATGQLVTDAAYGTALVEANQTTPVMWPKGYTSRASGWEVDVVDKSGHVVARTGTRVEIEGGYQGENPRAFFACGYVLSR
jgi:hypothetical protein